MGNLIAVRYVGSYEVRLGKYGGPYFDGNGAPLSSLLLRPGDTLMMNEDEVKGVTWKFDPRRELDPVFIGPGNCVPSDLSADEALDLGYQYHLGRADFVPVQTTGPLPVLEPETDGSVQ